MTPWTITRNWFRRKSRRYSWQCYGCETSGFAPTEPDAGFLAARHYKIMHLDGRRFS